MLCGINHIAKIPRLDCLGLPALLLDEILVVFRKQKAVNPDSLGILLQKFNVVSLNQ